METSAVVRYSPLALATSILAGSIRTTPSSVAAAIATGRAYAPHQTLTSPLAPAGVTRAGFGRTALWFVGVNRGSHQYHLKVLFGQSVLESRTLVACEQMAQLPAGGTTNMVNLSHHAVLFSQSAPATIIPVESKLTSRLYAGDVMNTGSPRHRKPCSNRSALVMSILAGCVQMVE